MIRVCTCLAAVLLGCALQTALAELTIELEKPQPEVFGGGMCTLNLRCRNDDAGSVETQWRTRVYEAGSATAVRISETSWQRLLVHPQQTVLASARLELPPVKARTRFLVQWVDGANRIAGKGELWVHPTHLLAEIPARLRGQTLGVLDPSNQLKPALLANGVGFVDLSEMPLEGFGGRLAILGPFGAEAPMREGLPETVRALAAQGASIVWLRPPPEPGQDMLPSFYLVPEGKGVLVMAQSNLIDRFSESPQAQLNLIRLCRLALRPQSFSFPNNPY